MTSVKMTSSEITSHQICCSNKVALSSAVIKKKLPHGCMAERNLELSSILPLTTLQTSI